MTADEFGPVCTNPACADEIARLNELVTRMDNDNAELNGRYQDLGAYITEEPAATDDVALITADELQVGHVTRYGLVTKIHHKSAGIVDVAIAEDGARTFKPADQVLVYGDARPLHHAFTTNA